MTDRDERPLWKRLKFVLPASAMLLVLVVVAIGAYTERLDSTAYAAAFYAFMGLGGSGTIGAAYEDGQREKRG